MNLGILIFLGVNFRFAILNLTQYGYLMRFSLANIFHPNTISYWSIVNGQIILFFGTYFVEKKIAPTNLHNPKVIYTAHLAIFILRNLTCIYGVIGDMYMETQPIRRDTIKDTTRLSVLN